MCAPSAVWTCPGPGSAGPREFAVACRGPADGESECQKACATIAGSRPSHSKTAWLGSKALLAQRFMRMQSPPVITSYLYPLHADIYGFCYRFVIALNGTF